MSIVTRTGDAGTTSLMFNRRVPKHHPRVEAYGAVDELNAALGLARARCADTALNERLAGLQQELILLMGELATDSADLERFRRAGFHTVEPAMTARLEVWIGELEATLPPPRGWLLPGHDESSAALHLARTVCRRAERLTSVLLTHHQHDNPETLIYLNRLGDLLWLIARRVEENG